MSTSIEQRKFRIRANRARRQRQELSNLVHFESRRRAIFVTGALIVSIGWVLIFLVYIMRIP